MMNANRWFIPSLKRGSLEHFMFCFPESLFMRQFFSQPRHSSDLKGNDEDQCHKCLRFLEKNDLKRALKEIENVLLIGPENIFAWQCKAYILVSLNAPQEALHALTKAAELNPTDERIWHSVGRILIHLGLYRDAITAFDRVTSQNPCHTDAWFCKAFVHARQENIQFSLDSLYKALEYSSPLFREIYRLSISIDDKLRLLVPEHHQKKLFGSPFFDKNTDISDLKDVLKAWFVHSTSPLADERIVQFLNVCERMIENNLSDTRTWMLKGIALIELNKTYEALHAFDHAIEIDPKIADDWYWFKRAQLFAMLGDRKKAHSYFDEATKLRPSLRKYAQYIPVFGYLLSSNTFKTTVA